MGLPAANLPFPVLDLGRLLEHLPAEARAQLAWAKKPIEDGIARLRTEVLTDALVDEVAVVLRRPILASMHQAWQWIVRLGDIQDIIEAGLAADHERLRSLLPDDEAKDTLDWVMEFLHSLMATIGEISVPGDGEASAREVEESDLPALQPYLRGSVALMAVSEIAKQPSVPPEAVERAKDLLDVAFLGFMEFGDQVSDAFDVSFDPPSTAPARQGDRLALYAQGVRDALSDADWEKIESARMGNLR